MPSIAVFGESLVDVTRTGFQRRVRPGGSPLNVAVGLSRLGAEVEFATCLGSDEYGKLIQSYLSEERVVVTPSSIGGGPTSVAEATVGPDGSASYRFDLLWDPAAPPAGRGGAAHFGSIGAVLSPGARLVLEWVEAVRPHSVVSFDPNVRTSITGSGAPLLDAVDRGAALADLIKVSAEDLEVLGDLSIVERWLSGDTAVVVITDGARGARVVTAAGAIDVPATPPAGVADTIGAGDSFMAALLWSLGVGGMLDREVLRTASSNDFAQHAAFAADCASMTVSREGADPPTLLEVDARRREQGLSPSRPRP